MGKKLGFIGLGQMGLPMAKLLLKHGYSVYGCDVKIDAIKEFQQWGGIPSSMEEIAIKTEATILMLPDSKIVQDVLFGSSGLSQYWQIGCCNGKVIIDMGSSSPMETKKNEQRLKEWNIHLLDAPVSGGVKKAITGELTIMAGGDQTCFQDHYPILEILGEKIFYLGESGSGHVLKALNNYLSASHLLSSCEVLHALTILEIDPILAFQAINQSTGRSGSTEFKLPQYIIPGRFQSGFSLQLLSKDVSMAKDIFQEMNIHPLIAKSIVDIYANALDELGKEADHTEIFRFVAAFSQKNH